LLGILFIGSIQGFETASKGESNMFARSLTAMILLLITPLAPSAAAQPDGHGHTHGKPAEFKTPTSYKAAVAEIRMRLHEIDVLITTKKLVDVHGQAEVIQKVGNLVGQLALKADSGVPKTAIREVNKAGRELANKFDAIDRAGDSGDGPGTRKVYAEMVKLADVLYKHSPKDYVCPMACEGEKTYPTQQKCPECRMDLQDVNSHQDHSAKHGGTFFMAADKKHHLEGTISKTKEFRIYFYDEFTKPLPAEKYSAKGTAWTGGKDAETALKMTPVASKDYLTAQVDASVSFPVRVKVFIDFKNGMDPQVFDFDFAEPSKEPENMESGKSHPASAPHEKEHGKTDIKPKG